MDNLSKLKDVVNRIESGLAGISPDLKPEIQEQKRKEVFAEWSDHLHELTRRVREWQTEKQAERETLTDPQLALFDAAYKKHGSQALSLIDNMTPQQLIHVCEKYNDPLISAQAVKAIKSAEGVGKTLLHRFEQHMNSFVNSEQVKHNANQELECLNVLHDAEQVTGNTDPQRKLAYGRRKQELEKLAGGE